MPSFDYCLGTNLDQWWHTSGRLQRPNQMAQLDNYQKHQHLPAYLANFELLLDQR